MHAIPLFRSNAIAKTDWMPILGGIVITIVVNVTYFSARNIGFWSDDYAFIEVAARLSFLENLIWYFDPRLQFLWYRPIPGMLWWIEWQLFRNNPLGYHLVYVLIHLANCLLLYAIVARVLRNWLSGFASALVYAGISVYSHAVLRPSDETALAVLFYLLTILFWIHFLLKQNWRLYVCAYLFFVLALFSKEASVTLPVMLFLVDRLLVGSKAAINLLVRRYLPLLLILIPYLAFELALAPNTLSWTLARIQPSNFEKQKIMRSFDRSSHSLGARNPEQPLPYSTVASQGNGRALATPPSFNRGRDSRNAEAPA